MKTYLLLILLLVSGQLAANPIDRSTALKQAQTFMQNRGKKLNVATTSFKAPRRSSTATANSASYYVFNNTSGGFIVVSGDDRTLQILGYSDEGKLDESNLPLNISSWLQGYADQIAYLDDSITATKTSAAKTSPLRAQKTTRPISPMLTSLWNQGSPFNNDCPIYYKSDGTQGQSVTGCTATSMAQIMYYHKWPASTIAEIPSLTNKYKQSTGLYKTVTLPAISNGTAIDWENMTDGYTSTSTDAQNAAVAKLMLLCGQSIQMKYGPQSGASNIMTALKLIKTFGYDDGVKYINRSNYSITGWDDIIYSELADKRPVIYNGSSTGGGHSFVVDGYDGDGLYHLNWGWGGYANGYFALAVLNPYGGGIGASSTSDGYSMSQGAVIGVMPPDTNVAEEEPLKLTTSNLAISNDSIYSSYFNVTYKTASFEFGIGYVDDDGNITSIGNTYYYENLANATGFGKLGYKVEGLSAGTYKVVTISRELNTTKWFTDMDVKKKYVLAKVNAGGKVSLSIYEQNVALSADISFSGPKYSGKQQAADISLKNNGDEFYGKIYFFISTSADVKGDYNSSTGAAVPANGTSKISFPFTPATGGTYYVWVATDETGSNIIGSSKVEINNSSELSTSVSGGDININYSEIAKDYTYVYGDLITGYVTLKNNDTAKPYANTISFVFYGNTGDGNYSGIYSGFTDVSIPAGGTCKVPFSYKGNIGTDYFIDVFDYNVDNNAQLIKEYYSFYLLKPGYITYKADGSYNAEAPLKNINVAGDVVAVNLTGVTAVKSIVTNSNPNTVYIFGEDETLPNGLSGKNIIKGSSAETLSLTDGHDFFVPATITAKEINYTRTPELQSNGTNCWETIALPFNVDKITTEGKEIDFFHSASDRNKDFWVNEFSELNDDNKLVFRYAEKMDAYIPYIIAFPESLKNKKVVFHGTDATIAPNSKIIIGSHVYNMRGTTTKLSTSNAYVLNNPGNGFIMNSSATVEPFRAFFTADGTTDGLPEELSIIINGADISSAISLPAATEGKTVDIFSLSGVKVASTKVVDGHVNTNALPKGIYVVKGKKFIVK